MQGARDDWRLHAGNGLVQGERVLGLELRVEGLRFRV